MIGPDSSSPHSGILSCPIGEVDIQSFVNPDPAEKRPKFPVIVYTHQER